MFCPKCGTQNEDTATFCKSCGTKLNAQSAPNQGWGAPTPTPTPGFTTASYSNNMPMKWYKFLIYFLLWLSGVGNILGSIPYFSGSVYDSQGVSSELVYLVFPSLKTLNILYAIVLIALGALAIYTRFRLAAYAKNGPQLLNILYGVSAAASLLYALINGSVIDDYSAMPVAIITIIVSVAIIVLNRIYFSKRASLFVN